MTNEDPSVAAWREFCETMADAGEMVLAPGVPDDPNVRAEGIRTLSRYLTFALERCLERSGQSRGITEPALVPLQRPGAHG